MIHLCVVSILLLKADSLRIKISLEMKDLNSSLGIRRLYPRIILARLTKTTNRPQDRRPLWLRSWPPKYEASTLQRHLPFVLASYLFRLPPAEKSVYATDFSETTLHTMRVASGTSRFEASISTCINVCRNLHLCENSGKRLLPSAIQYQITRHASGNRSHLPSWIRGRLLTATTS
jgi:hypothetical protein